MSGMVEFRITSDLQEIRKQAITTNYPEVKAWVDGVAEQYRSIVVTEDGVQAAKQDRANLRKLQANIDQVRKECRAAALAVSAETEANCKELVATLETAVQNLDTQAKAFETRRKEEKKNRLSAYFDQAVCDMAEWLTFDDCFNPKWLNATYAESAAWSDIDAAIDRCRADLNAIRALHSEFETTLLDEYTRTRNISAVLVKNETLCRMKAVEEERKRKETEAAAKYAAAQRQKMTPLKPECIGESDEYEVIDIVGTVEPQQEQPANDLVDEDGCEMPTVQEAPSVADVIRAVEQEAFAYAAVEDEPTYTLYFDPHCTDEQFMELLKYMDGAGIRRTLRVDGTAAQLNGLRTYMKNNGIRFERVPE